MDLPLQPSAFQQIRRAGAKLDMVVIALVFGEELTEHRTILSEFGQVEDVTASYPTLFRSLILVLVSNFFHGISFWSLHGLCMVKSPAKPLPEPFPGAAEVMEVCLFGISLCVAGA